MSNTRLIRSFLMITVVVSIVLAYVGGLLSLSDGAPISVSYLLFGPILIAPLYALFVFLGGLVFGVPALMALRSAGATRSRTQFVLSGILIGAIAGSLILGLWLSLGVVLFGAVYGVVGGGLAALMWFEMVESRLKND